ncbi:MAG: ABC transporter ATP-binding protein [Wenzhouxiangella sp.]|nr:ABC transporter ATP-binding protein [Wenzhouxiangella sp.]MCH8477766.1 ABC transporter ATP-binding protein [Wenzhouxiangella sp.]
MTAALNVECLSITRGQRPVLQDLHFSLNRGEMLALVGPNGSGKSTLMQCIAGLLKPQSGRIYIDGCSLDEQLVEARTRLGYMVPQEQLPGLLSGRQCLELFARSRGLNEIPPESLLQAERLGLSPWTDKWVMNYSLGTRQKLSILLALIDAPPLILLDEPLNGLDPVSALALKKMLRELSSRQNCCIVMATHDLAIIEQLRSHVIVLLDGRIMLDWDQARIRQETSRRGQSLEEVIVQALSAPLFGENLLRQVPVEE